MTDQLGPDFDERLTRELDRFVAPTPLPQRARFSGRQMGHRRLGRMKPVLAVAGALAILLVAASVLAGSPDPTVWTRHAVNSFESVTHAGQSSPSPESGGSHQVQPPAHTQPSETGEPSHESPEPSGGPQTEPSEQPTATPSPEPDGTGSASPTPSPSPSPGAGDGATQSPSPSP